MGLPFLNWNSQSGWKDPTSSGHDSECEWVEYNLSGERRRKGLSAGGGVGV